MMYVYDVEYEVYHKDVRSGAGFWSKTNSVSVVANGSIEKALRKAERVVLSEKVKPEKDKDTGKVYCFRPRRVKVTSIIQVREVAE